VVWSTGGVQRYPSDKGKKLLRPNEIFDIRGSSKTSEFSKKSPLSGAEKHPDFQVTQCFQNVTTNVDFAYIESEQISIFFQDTNIY
jgi:hypothetical protein